MYNSCKPKDLFEENRVIISNDIFKNTYRYCQDLIDVLAENSENNELLDCLGKSEDPLEIVYCMLQYSTQSPVHESAYTLSLRLAEIRTKDHFPSWSLADDESQ